MTRLLLILTLLLQPALVLGQGVACAGAIQSSAMAVAGCCCGPDACCDMDDAPSMCGCGDERSTPVEPAVPPSEERPVVTLLLCLPSEIALDADEPRVLIAATALPPKFQSNSQRQAFLSIWRT